MALTRSKQVLIGIGALLVLLILAAPLILRAMFPESKLRALVLPKAQAALGRSVDCSRLGLGLGLRGLTLELEGLRLGADSTGYGLRRLDLPRLEARLALVPLLKREIAIKTLIFVEPSAELLLPPAGAASTAAKAAAGEAASTAAVAVAAPDLRLERARVRLVREGKGGLDLEARIETGRFASALRPGGDLELSGTLERVALAGSLADGRALSGKANLELDLAIAEGQLNLRRSALDLTELALGGESDTLRLRLEQLALDASLSGPLAAFKGKQPDLAALTLKGDLEAAGLRVNVAGAAPLEITLPRVEAPLSLAGGEGILRATVRASEGSLSGRTADGRPLEAGLAGEAELACAPEELGLAHLALRLTQLRIAALPAAAGDGTLPKPDLLLASLTLEGTGSAPLAALQATPPDYAAAGVAFSGRLKAEQLTLERKTTAPLKLTVPGGQGPWAMGAATQGAFAINGLSFGAGTLSLAPPTGGSLTGTLPAGRLDISLVPGPKALAIPRLVLALEGYTLQSQPGAGPPVTLRGEGATLRASASLPKDPARKPEAHLDLTLGPLVAEGKGLAKPIRLDNIELAGALEELSLRSLRLRAGGSELNATGTVTGAPAAPRAALQVQSGLIDLADFVVPTKQGVAATGGQTAATPPPVLPPIPGRADFRIERLVSPVATVTALTGRLSAEASGLRLEDLKGALLGGNLAGSFLLAPRADGAFDAKGDFKVQRVQAPAFLAALTPIERGIEGTLSTETGFSFVMKPGEKAQGLSLDAGVDLLDGALVGVPFLKSLAQLAGLPSKERYALGRLQHQFQLRQDRLLTRDLRLPFEDGWITATGSAGLDGSLDFKGRWELGASTLSRLGAGSTLAFLKNAKGKVELDFLVKGNAKEPAITLDTKSMEASLAEQAKQKLQEQGGDLIKKGLDALKKK